MTPFAAMIEGADLLRAFLAQEAGQAQNPLVTFGFLGAMVVIFYFLIIRPQSKQAKDHKAMLSALKKGDVVIVNGMLGRIHTVSEKFMVVEVAPSVRIRVLAGSIQQKAPEGLYDEEIKGDKTEK